MNRRYKMSKGEAIDLQEWALKESRAKEFLDSLPEFPKKGKIKPGLYVDYEIDEDELDDGLDWPTSSVATIYAVLGDNGGEIYLGEITAYNFETYWLATREYEEVDTAENWFELIKKDYENLIKSENSKKKNQPKNNEEANKIKNKEEKYNKSALTKEESEAIYKIVKEYEQNSPEGDGEYYDDYYDEYKTPINNKIIKSILRKVINSLSKEQIEEIDKDFLREKYHSFNNEINEGVYRNIEKGFAQLKTIEIKYFNMESAGFSKRKLNVYYKSRKYVIGYCHLRKDMRKFRTSRIASAKLTNERYKIPEDFDKKEY